MSLRTLSTALLAAALAAPTAAHAQIRDVSGFTSSLVNGQRNDDGYSTNVNVGFDYDFFGLKGSTVNVSNNGFIAFGTQPSYTPEALASNKVIAAFWADIDTRDAGSAAAVFGTGSVDVSGVGTRNAFYVNWPGVGYFASRSDKLNAFQIFLVDRNDRGLGDFDFELNYGSMEWEAGNNNDGGPTNNGLCAGPDAKPARAGYSNGSNVTVELPGSGVCGALINGGPNALNGQRFAYSAQSGLVQEIPQATVPEPSTWALMGTGLVGMATVARRRRRSA